MQHHINLNMFGKRDPAQYGTVTLQLRVQNKGWQPLEFTCALPSLAAGTIASVFATLSGDTLRLVAWFDDGTTAVIACEAAVQPAANLRAIHLSPDAPVDTETRYNIRPDPGGVVGAERGPGPDVGSSGEVVPPAPAAATASAALSTARVTP
jgi:hypothetical protein